MRKIKLKELLRAATALAEKKNAVGKAPSIGLTIHVDSTYDPDTKQVSITVSSQSVKAPEYIIPDVASQDSVQEIISGLESEMGAAIKGFSKALDKILSKYQ